MCLSHIIFDITAHFAIRLRCENRRRRLSSVSPSISARVAQLTKGCGDRQDWTHLTTGRCTLDRGLPNYTRIAWATMHSWVIEASSNSVSAKFPDNSPHEQCIAGRGEHQRVTHYWYGYGDETPETCNIRNRRTLVDSRIPVPRSVCSTNEG